MQHWALVILPISAVLLSGAASAPASDTKETTMDIAPVWSGHPVGFALLTHGDRQYVAFYDAERNLTVGSRGIDEAKWHFAKLPETLGWDSHNYIAMAMDDAGCIHLCANMHVKPLTYFRTAKPGDIDSFERIDHMTGKNEEKCTYPSFFRGPHNEFLFTYRSGSSGNGDQYYNIYDTKTKAWKPLMDQPLTAGEGVMNAYFYGLRLGPDGYYHMVWIWRDTGDCVTNHDISYARSKDLVHWEHSDGKSFELPITLAKCEIVDPVPVKAGAINTGFALGFDSRKRPVVSYIKYDEKGLTQLYDARLEQGQWKIYKISSWDYRWEFAGYGSIAGEVHVGPVSVKDGKLVQGYGHIKYGSGHFVLDEATMKVLDDVQDAPPSAHPQKTMEAPDNTLQPRRCGDAGSSGKPGVKYELRWETLSVNRDHKREGTPPPPSMLKLVRIGK